MSKPQTAKFIQHLGRISDRAHEYFGHDVQRYWVERPERGVYHLYQLTHRMGTRIAASAYCFTAREAIREFNRMARG